MAPAGAWREKAEERREDPRRLRVYRFGEGGSKGLYVYNLWCPGIGMILNRLPFGYRGIN